jgi:hypothetical protein
MSGGGKSISHPRCTHLVPSFFFNPPRGYRFSLLVGREERLEALLPSIVVLLDIGGKNNRRLDYIVERSETVIVLYRRHYHNIIVERSDLLSSNFVIIVDCHESLIFDRALPIRIRDAKFRSFFHHDDLFFHLYTTKGSIRLSSVIALQISNGHIIVDEIILHF